MTSSPIEIEPLRSRRHLNDWLAVPGQIYGADPHFVEPLHLAERQRIDRGHNPFFLHGEAEFFLAYSQKTPVGRISAQINRAFQAVHGSKIGHFGFFDCIDDQAVSQALLKQATRWLSDRGQSVIQGPFNLTINQDCGLLVDGFDSPPAILTSHAGAWSGSLLEQFGMRKSIDLFAYRMSPQQSPNELERLANWAKRTGRIRIRSVDMSRFEEEAKLIFDIFNDAWSDNWGFVPISDADLTAIIKEMRPIMRGKFGFVAEIDGEPAAMLIVLPDINQVIAPFKGRLLPVNWARLGYAIFADQWKTARIPLLGIRKKHRNNALAAGVLSLLVSEALKLGRTYDLEWVEFSWILETNAAMVNLAKLAAGPPKKTYRIYEMTLDPRAA